MHKYGFHVNRSGDDVFDAIRRLKPAVIKTLEYDIGFWQRVREIHPEVFLIGRDYITNQEQDRFIENPKEHGLKYADKVLGLEVNNIDYNGRPLFDAWETYNELMPGHAEERLKRGYDEFQVAFGEKLRAGGFEPVGMNFATGNMMAEDFLNLFAGTLETYRYLGFHEYDWPDMWRLHRQNIEEKDEGGMWLTLRYRRIMSDVRKVYPNRHIVVMTECGMTQGVQGGEDVGQWHESHPIEESRYWDSLMWYNDELMKDDYMIGACLFVIGAIEPWHSFEHLGGICNRLEQLQGGQPLPTVPRPHTPNAMQPAFGKAAPGPNEEAPPLVDPKPVTPAPVQPEPVQPAPSEQPIQVGIDSSLGDILKAEAVNRQTIHFNPNAALQKVIFADGFVPNTPEFTMAYRGTEYVAQQAEHLGTGERRVYCVPVGDWGNVTYV